MKGNNGSGNIEKRDFWQTPNELFIKLNKQYKFFIDCCANEHNTKCNKFFTDFESVDFIHDNIVCWMNPPFSKVSDMFAHFNKVVSKGVAIYRCDNFETQVWQEVIFPNASWIFIPKGRVNYEGSEGKGSRFPSALIGFNVPIPKGLNGVVLRK